MLVVYKLFFIPLLTTLQAQMQSKHRRRCMSSCRRRATVLDTIGCLSLTAQRPRYHISSILSSYFRPAPLILSLSSVAKHLGRTGFGRGSLQPFHMADPDHEHRLQERDFDEFARHIRAAAPSDPLIFNCQLGGGRTTTGTIIGCLVRSFATDGNTATQSTNGTEASAGSRWPAEGVCCLQPGQPSLIQRIC